MRRGSRGSLLPLCYKNRRFSVNEPPNSPVYPGERNDDTTFHLSSFLAAPSEPPPRRGGPFFPLRSRSGFRRPLPDAGHGTFATDADLKVGLEARARHPPHRLPYRLKRTSPPASEPQAGSGLLSMVEHAEEQDFGHRGGSVGPHGLRRRVRAFRKRKREPALACRVSDQATLCSRGLQS